MMSNPSVSTAPPADLFGPMLRTWRRRRGASQLALALQSGVSQRHVSFLESGGGAWETGGETEGLLIMGWTLAPARGSADYLPRN